MKGSGVVQSWKALASKINNQTPLGPKESNRLLTALTSSFRKHLDEVHPNQPRDSGKRTGQRNEPTKTGRHGDHSSAASADQHFASMLTNPLMAKHLASPNGPKVETPVMKAKAELEKGADALDLLDAYHAKGDATVDVALVSIEHFKASMKGMSYDDQVAKVKEKTAGTRVLSWLWNSGALHSEAYVNNGPLQDGLVWLVMTEGHEEFLWKWLDSDLQLAAPVAVKKSRTFYPGRERFPGYMWKARILYAMVQTRLGPPHSEAGSADAALQTYFRALNDVHKRNPDLAYKLIITHPAKVALKRALVGTRYANTSLFLFDQFTNLFGNNESDHAGSIAFDAWNRASLDLWRPEKPSATALYALITHKSFEDPDGDFKPLRQKMESLEEKGELDFFSKMFSRGIYLLTISEDYAGASRLANIAASLIPTRAGRFKNVVQHTRKKERLIREQPKDTNQQVSTHEWLYRGFPAPT